MKYKIVSILFIVMMIASSIALGWGPATHKAILDKALSESENTLIKQIIESNLDACYAGLVYADVGIFEYFVNFKAYKGLHSYATVDEMLKLASGSPRKQAFTYCYKIHLGGDGISHTYYVPAAIKRTKIPNYIIHAPVELKIEGYYLDPVANRLMERHAEFDEFVEQATGRDWSPEAARLNTLIGGGEFYTKAFAPDSSTWFARLQGYFYKFVRIFVSEETSIDYFKLSVEESKSILRGETPLLDPSGELALKQADEETQLVLYIVSIGIIVGALWIMIKKKWI